MKEIVIEKVSSREKYEGLRDLWVRVFGDEPESVDAVYENFGADLSFTTGSGGDIAGFVICNDDGMVVSSLTLYRCGSLYVPDRYEEYYETYEEDPEADEEEYADETAAADGLPVYVSYAICTDPEYRGQGLAAALTEHVRELVTGKPGLGGISLVSPAEPSLIDFYGRLGYSEGFYACEGIGFPEMLEYNEDLFDDYDDDYEESDADVMMWGLDAEGMPGLIDGDSADTFEPELSVVSVDGATYNRYREAFLSDTVHIALSSRMIDTVRMFSLNGDGLVVINGGDAIAVINSIGEPGQGAYKENGHGTGLYAEELLVSPMLMEYSAEIDMEIAARLAVHFGLERLKYKTPGYGISQSMYAVSGVTEIIGYYGFPIE